MAGRLLPLITISRASPPTWEEVRERILKLLKDRNKATLRELERLLNLSPSYRGLLVLALGMLEVEERIKSESLTIPVEGGLVRVKVFSLKEH